MGSKSLTDIFRKASELLRSNPGLFFKRSVSEIKSLFPFRKAVVQKSINGVLFEFDFLRDPSIKLMYDGIYEEEIVAAVRRHLKNGETFIDVGANIGYISAVGLGQVGIGGEVHSFEPVPEFFSRLETLKGLNPNLRFYPNQCALGENESTARIAVSNVSNIGWNTMVPGMMSNETIQQEIEVPVIRLDRYIEEHNLKNVSLIKIDTEGFEFPVLKGLQKYFESSRRKPAIICEVAPSAYPLLGCTLQQLRDYLVRFGYKSYHVDGRDLDVTRLTVTTNVLFTSSIT